MKHCTQKILLYQTQYKTSVGYIYSIVGSICMSIMQVCAKQLAFYLMTSQILLYRSFCLAIVNTIFTYLSNHNVYIKKHRVWKILCIRMIVSALAVYLQFLPLKYMPIGIVNSIRMTAPICTHFLESCIIGTKINKRDLLITCISFTGIILLVKPEVIFGETSTVQIPIVYAIVTFFGTLFLSLQLIMIRLIKDDVTNDIILQYFYISQISINTLLFIGYQIKTQETLPIVPSCIVLFVILVIVGYSGQMLNTRALYLISASQSMPFRYVGVIIGFMIDVLYYGISFDWIMILGLVITSVSLAFLTAGKGKDKGKEKIKSQS